MTNYHRHNHPAVYDDLKFINPEAMRAEEWKQSSQLWQSIAMDTSKRFCVAAVAAAVGWALLLVSFAMSVFNNN